VALGVGDGLGPTVGVGAAGTDAVGATVGAALGPPDAPQPAVVKAVSVSAAATRRQLNRSRTATDGPPLAFAGETRRALRCCGCGQACAVRCR
jgi:hypothetical protein